MVLLSSCRPASTGQAGGMKDDPDYYQEAHRPQFHFSPEEQWMNDPNGMVYFEGEYHLFYQYYPDSNVWGPMHWGHAVSSDLVRWEHLPIALYPDSLGYIFSGSAVVDWNNTSGLGKDGEPPLIAIFTHHDPAGADAGRQDFQYQSIAYSHDQGRTWTKYPGNPVIPNTLGIRDFRDPKVIWDEASRQWVMVFAANDRVKFWGSPNLIDWTFLSDWGMAYGEHGGVWECPDLFPMTVEETGDQKWVLLQSLNPGGPNGGSATQYFIGDFDGRHFSLDPAFADAVRDGKAVWLDYGKDNYAGVTWSDIPRTDGRRIFLGWMSNWQYATIVPTTVWRSAMTLPRELTLHQTREGLRLKSNPVRELRQLRLDTFDLTDAAWNAPLALPGGGPRQLEMELEFLIQDQDADFGIRLTNEEGQSFLVGYREADRRYYADRTHAGRHGFSADFAAAPSSGPRIVAGDTLKMHLFFDRASCELFADGGATVMTDIFFPDEDFNRVQFFLAGGSAKLLKASAYPLSGIWNDAQLASRK